jgi:hypothetical protein
MYCDCGRIKNLRCGGASRKWPVDEKIPAFFARQLQQGLDMPT